LATENPRTGLIYGKGLEARAGYYGCHVITSANLLELDEPRNRAKLNIYDAYPPLGKEQTRSFTPSHAADSSSPEDPQPPRDPSPPKVTKLPSFDLNHHHPLFDRAMGLPSISPSVRILIGTRPDHLQKTHPSPDQADTKLIEEVYVELSITNKTKITHLITKISDQKNSKERMDIVFDYDVPINGYQPQVVAYAVTVGG
jgi:hypothetical protein